MDNIINGIRVPFIPIVPYEEAFSPPAKSGSESFGDVFQNELARVKFSGHAAKRLESRDIKLNETDLNSLQNAVNKAEQKGAKDSLVMMDDMAFIVNVPNRTVITAMKLSEKSDSMFTNIDSVVFA